MSSVNGSIDEEEVFVALYPFNGNGSNNLLTLSRGCQVKVLRYNETGEWCESCVVKKVDKSVAVGESGWVPSNYITPAYCLDKHLWYHGALSRNAAEYMLTSGISGSFLIRESESVPGKLSISLRHEESVYHYHINQTLNDDKYFLSQEMKFDTIPELVHFYSYASEGLVTTLHYPMLKQTLGSNEMLSSVDEWELNRHDIIMRRTLGGGQYGEVYEALLKSHGKNSIVAVKTLRQDAASTEEFLKEVAVMKSVKHPNLVELLGVCTSSPPFYIVTEFMNRGNLLEYLRKCDHTVIRAKTLIHIATQIASGMRYLEDKNYIHRDLAARNCLVKDNNIVKVADFGLSRFIAVSDDYTAHAGSKFPIKWTAPESLAYNKFSTKSDVWSYGVLIWEIFSYGLSPYPGTDLSELYVKLEGGYRMDCPKNCDKKIHELMLKCCDWEPNERPTFNKLHRNLTNLFHSFSQLPHPPEQPPPPRLPRKGKYALN